MQSTLDFYPDLQKAFGPENYERAVIHWLEYGLAERRKSSSPENFPEYKDLLAPSLFDASYYLGLYPDLQAEFGSENYEMAKWHWVEKGFNEKRKGAP